MRPVVKMVAYVPPAPAFAPRVQIRRVRAAPRQHAPVPRITAEERALVQFATTDPNQLRESLDDLEKRTSEPIQVSEIKIEPLEVQ